MPVTRESINEHCGWAPAGCHSMIIREGLGRRGSWHSWVWSLSLRHYAPPSCMPTACRNFVRHQRLVVRKRRYMIWYMSIYIYVCVCVKETTRNVVDFCCYKLNRYSTWLALQGIVIWLYMNIVVHVVFQSYLVSISRCIVSCKVSADLVALIRIRVRISVEWRHLLGPLSRGLWICTKWTKEKALVSSKHPLRSLYAAPPLYYFDLFCLRHLLPYHLDPLSDIIYVCSIDCNATLCLMIEDGQTILYYEYMNTVLKKLSWKDSLLLFFEKIHRCEARLHLCSQLHEDVCGLHGSQHVSTPQRGYVRRCGDVDNKCYKWSLEGHCSTSASKLQLQDHSAKSGNMVFMRRWVLWVYMVLLHHYRHAHFQKNKKSLFESSLAELPGLSSYPLRWPRPLDSVLSAVATARRTVAAQRGQTRLALVTSLKLVCKTDQDHILEG